MSKKQSYILNATLVVIVVLLFINIFFNVRSSSSETPLYTAEQIGTQEPIEQIEETVLSAEEEEKVNTSDFILLEANLYISNDIATITYNTDVSGAEEAISCNIPKPAESQDAILSRNTSGYDYGKNYGYKIYSDEYLIFPYLDTNGNIVNLRVTLDSDFKPSIDFEIIESNVKKIISVDDNLSRRIVYQPKIGDYKFAVISNTGELSKVIDLNEQTVPEFYIFYYEVVTAENVLINSLEIDYEVLGYGEIGHTFYEFEKPIICNKDTYDILDPLLKGWHRACEFEELYEKLMQAVNKINSKTSL